jgi:hypothetical protein
MHVAPLLQERGRRRGGKPLNEAYTIVGQIRDFINVLKNFNDAYFKKQPSDMTPEMRAETSKALKKAKSQSENAKPLEPPKEYKGDPEKEANYKKIEPWVRLACFAVTNMIPGTDVDDIKPMCDHLIITGKMDWDKASDIAIMLVSHVAMACAAPLLLPKFIGHDVKKITGSAKAEKTSEKIADAAVQSALEAEMENDVEKGLIKGAKGGEASPAEDVTPPKTETKKPRRRVRLESRGPRFAHEDRTILDQLRTDGIID